MNIYKITLAYDGTKYRGWQRQQNTKETVQGTVERALTLIAGHKVSIDGSGRTDSGVHASGQTASFTIHGKLDEQDAVEKLNIILPKDIQVVDIQRMKENFHARKSAVGKCYEYRIDQRDKPDVFTRKYCLHFPYKLNIAAMEAAIQVLKGTHDFLAFTDQKDSEDTVRTIYDIVISKSEDKIKISYYGNGFLYHMVRILTGTLLDVGTGKIRPDRIQSILDGRDRSKSGFPAPAKGLCLRQVYYGNWRYKKENNK